MRLAVVLATLAATAGAAHAERPRGIYKFEEPRGPRPVAATLAEKTNRIIYMNRHGGTYYPGTNDSSTNNSTIPDQTSMVPAWTWGDEAWDQLMACTEDMFSRFNITITDEDPGDVPHIESVVAGRPEDVGMPGFVGGVAPMNCSVIERAIVFTFAEIYFGDVQEICHTVAQEAMHAFGLDHELLCQDPMTYLGGCGAKTFQDVDAQCGEFEPRWCQCGSMTQNSVAYILEKVGPPDHVAPTITIDAPEAGATVPPRFVVSTTPEDDSAVTRVELWIDGVKVASVSRRPWQLTAPAELPYGPHGVEARVIDRGGNVASAEIEVTISPECGPDAGGAACGEGLECVEGRCATGLGSTCANHADCASGICAAGDEDGFDYTCTRTCSATEECPTGLECGKSNLCWPASGEGGGGCAIGSSRAALPAGLTLLLLLLLGLRPKSKVRS